jgi:hypothetical protein
MDDKIRDLFVKWVQQTQKTGEALRHAMDEMMAANALVRKISETLMAQDMTRKIQETNSGKQLFLN